MRAFRILISAVCLALAVSGCVLFRPSLPPDRHVVKEGDTLEILAEKYYHDVGKLELIRKANPGKLDPKLDIDEPLTEGMILKVPLEIRR